MRLPCFPFFNEASTTQIVLPKNPTDSQKWAAEHIQMYFRFWGKYGMTPTKEIELPILQDGEKVDHSKPVILIGNAANKIQRDGQTLNIGGVDLQQSTLQLLATLDHKYFYTGLLPTKGKDGEALKKAGLAGKTLK